MGMMQLRRTHAPWDPPLQQPGDTQVGSPGEIPQVGQGLPHQVLPWVSLSPCWVPGWVHPEQPRSREEPAAFPLPGRVLGYRNLLKCFSPSLAGPSKFRAYSFTLWASGTSKAV